MTLIPSQSESISLRPPRQAMSVNVRGTARLTGASVATVGTPWWSEEMHGRSTLRHHFISEFSGGQLLTSPMIPP